MAKGRKVRGVFWRHGEWWIRWACTLGHGHRTPSGDSKTAATEEHTARRAEVRQARKAGRECCPRLIRRDRPVLFEEILDDYMQYSERTKRSHNNDHARPNASRPSFATGWRSTSRRGRSRTSAPRSAMDELLPRSTTT